jgi:alpha-1,6-mannosyltransferase
MSASFRINGVPRPGPGAWALLGTVGSVLIALSAPQAVSGPGTSWWYSLSVPGATTVVYVGAAVLCLAWLGLGLELESLSPRLVLAIGALWLVPLILAPVVFSHDGYSYLAQGTVLRLGHNPYHSPPAILGRLGYGPTLEAVSPFWRHVTAPYGPLFLGLASLIARVSGSHLILGILFLRVLDLIGAALLAAAVPRLCRALGTDPRRGLWLVLLSPLLMLELIVPAHNDLLMTGLVVAGVAAALGGHPVAGAALCALGATIKVPAAAGAVFIAAAWLREERTAGARVQLLVAISLAVAAILAAVSVVTGLGFSWVSSSLFAAPARVRLAITPSTEVGYTVAGLLHGLGVHVASRSVEGVFTAASTVLIGLAGVVLLVRVRVGRLVRYLGGLLVLAAAGGPAAWPWYFSWGLALLAADRRAQGSRALWAAIVAAVFLIKPNGILALPLPTAPIVLLVYLILGGLFWRSRRGGSGGARGVGEAKPPDDAETRRPSSAAAFCRRVVLN